MVTVKIDSDLGICQTVEHLWGTCAGLLEKSQSEEARGRQRVGLTVAPEQGGLGQTGFWQEENVEQTTLSAYGENHDTGGQIGNTHTLRFQPLGSMMGIPTTVPGRHHESIPAIIDREQCFCGEFCFPGLHRPRYPANPVERD